MTTSVNPPPRLKIPAKFIADRETRDYFEQINTILFQQWTRSGGSTDRISESADQIDINNQDITLLNGEVNDINDSIERIRLDKRIAVRSAEDLTGYIDSTTEYFIDGIIDMEGQSIEVPEGGISISGYNFDLSQLVDSTDNHVMFVSSEGGSGNIVLKNVGLSTSGGSSQVYDLTPVDPFKAIEVISCNFNNCTSLGEITGYRQYFETGTGRFGGKPELTFSGSWNGARITSSIVRAIDDITSLFKEGTGLAFSGRFITDINCDLPSSGALIDFQESNIDNDESLIIQGAFITRDGLLDPTDTTIYPNINNDSIKSKWKNNTGLPNTNKYLKTRCTTEVETGIAATLTYYPLLGTITVDEGVHFDMPANGEFRLLTGDGSYSINANLVIVGSANRVIDIRVTKSEDDGATFPIEVNHIARQINNIVGSRDVSFFPISFITNLKKNDRLRLEVENKTDSSNVTMELDSYFIISEV